MKKKLYRERYNMINGKGEVLKEGLSIEDIKEMEIAKDESVNTIKIEKENYKER